MNLQEKFKIKIVQMSFSQDLCTCDSNMLNQRKRGQRHDFLHEIITHCINNQVNAWFKRKLREKKMQHVVGSTGNHLMLSWINWSNIPLQHRDHSKHWQYQWLCLLFGGCRWSSIWQRSCCYQSWDAEVTCFTNKLSSIKRRYISIMIILMSG